MGNYKIIILTFLSLALVNCVGLSPSNFRTAKALGKGEGQILTGIHTLGSSEVIEAMGRFPIAANYVDMGFAFNHKYMSLGFEIDAKYQFINAAGFSSALDLSVQNLHILFMSKEFQATSLVTTVPAWLLTYQMTDWLSVTSGAKAVLFLKPEYKPSKTMYGFPLSFDIGKTFGLMLEGTFFKNHYIDDHSWDFGAAFRYNIK